MPNFSRFSMPLNPAPASDQDERRDAAAEDKADEARLDLAILHAEQQQAVMDKVMEQIFRK